jgi:hypothetical protein
MPFVSEKTIELVVDVSGVPFNTTFHCIPDVSPVSLNETLC